MVVNSKKTKRAGEAKTAGTHRESRQEARLARKTEGAKLTGNRPRGLDHQSKSARASEGTWERGIGARGIERRGSKGGKHAGRQGDRETGRQGGF